MLRTEKDKSFIFRAMLKAWQAINDFSSAEQFLKNYPKPDSTHFYYANGYLNYLKANYFEAEEAFKKAVEMDPENGLAWNNLTFC